MLAKLSLSKSSFPELRTNKCLYVDKTKYAYDLITGNHYYFLSRPRRFGKSLFVSTLQEILKGNKSLFEDLWISRSDYTWKEHGVIMLDFSGRAIDDASSFVRVFARVLNQIAFDYECTIDFDPTDVEWTLEQVVRALHKKFGRVAILIDEYDSP